jgi:hypothetical protein
VAGPDGDNVAVLISSRSFTEYLAMFGLESSDLVGRTVVDVAAGGSDFVAAASAVAARAVAVDSAYAVEPDLLTAQLNDNTDTGLGIVDQHPNRFTWRWYGDRNSRDEMRRGAAQRFTIDRLASPGHYVGRDWHRDAILELARVGAEVRIFPLVVQRTGDEIGWLPELCDELRSGGMVVERRQVPYEFQTGADRMLVVSRSVVE